MDKKQSKELKAGDISADNLLVKNKNDDIDNTFCYKLFEEIISIQTNCSILSTLFRQKS